MEQLFCWSEEGIEEAINKRPRVLFGIRPCDLSAVAILDRFYLGNNKDVYYESRRKSTATIAIACNQPDPTCFCLGLGTGPFLKTGFDLQLTDLGDRFLVETGTETGAALIRDYSHIFGARPAASMRAAGIAKAVQQVNRRCGNAFRRRKLSLGMGGRPLFRVRRLRV
jgi:hypothetical protein